MYLRPSSLLPGCLFLVTCLLVACGQPVDALPTQVAAAVLKPAAHDGVVPPTWTAAPPPALKVAAPAARGNTPTPSRTSLPIPTNTPFTPPPTFTPSPTPSPETTVTPDRLPLGAYGSDEVIPLAAFPRPPGDNGWGMHWIPTVKQEPAVVDRFVAEATRMHIKWVVFLNDGTNVGDNDYLVRRLVANNIMPVMRLYRSTITPYDGDLGAAVRHYRSLGVYYFQLYNEPNVNVENHQGFANPNHYAAVWADAAREVIANGGLPGFGAFSPGGAYDHYEFLERTLRTLEFNGDAHLLNHAWLSVHNYHGTRPYDDPDGFLLFRKYDGIVRSHLLRSMPMIGTEGGTYSDSEETVKNYLAYQYRYMRDAEPYFMAFSYWLLANRLGGSHDDRWEYQALFREGYTHPVVPNFFHQNSE